MISDPHLALFRKQVESFIRAQSPERQKFRADFILGAIRQNAFPVTMEDIFAKATEAENFVFGVFKADAD